MKDAPDPGLLNAIFPPIVVPVGEVVGPGPDGLEYNQHFAGKTWQEVKRKHLERHTDAFSRMDSQSLRCYIAAFINLALNEPESQSAEYLVYFVGSSGFIEFCDLLEQEQVRYILNVVDWLADDTHYSTDDREKIEFAKSTLLNN